MRAGEKWLTAKQVDGSIAPGRYADGGGLYLDVDAATRRRWIYRYRYGDKRRDMGLGAAGDVTLAKARAERDRWRDVLREGRDPIDARAGSQRARIAAATTFGDVVDSYLKSHEAAWRNEKHRAQWRMTLDVYAAALRPRPVAEVSPADIMAILDPLWHAKPETASRLRGRIEAILDAARALGHIEQGVANPARWKGHLDKLLPKRKKLTRGHHAAMPFADLPEFVATLRRLDSISARALEFTILTAARTSETLLAEPAEFDLGTKLWTVPAARMKAGRIHRVPLTPRAVAIIAEMRDTFPASPYVFPGARPRMPLSNMALGMFIRKKNKACTVHGFRSSFSDWRGETTSFPRELAEAALAHVIGDETEAAYRRGDALDRRREMMLAWERFVTPPQTPPKPKPGSGARQGA